MRMHTRSAALFFVLGVSACSGDRSGGEIEGAALRLQRGSDGLVEIALERGPTAPAALQVELEIESSAGFTLEEAQAPRDLPLNTIKLRMRGTNHATLFSADSRGILLPRDGVLARFRVHSTEGSTATGLLRFGETLLVAPDGQKLVVDATNKLAVP